MNDWILNKLRNGEKITAADTHTQSEEGLEGEYKMKLEHTESTSNDYKGRFKAEYFQLKERYDKLDAMTVKYEAGTLSFTPSCSLELLKDQKRYMGCYMRCLKIRAQIEDINLDD